MTPTPTPIDCRAFHRALRRAESDPATASLDPLRHHLESCASCSRQRGARFASVEARAAFLHREVPDGMLDGFYAEIRQRVPLVPAGGGMSPTFLDAPRALRLWRTTALAASLLLVAGMGLVLGTDGERPVVGQRLHDPRERLLESFDAGRGAIAAPLMLRPLGTTRPRGQAEYFDPKGDTQAVDYEKRGTWE